MCKLHLMFPQCENDGGQRQIVKDKFAHQIRNVDTTPREQIRNHQVISRSKMDGSESEAESFNFCKSGIIITFLNRSVPTTRSKVSGYSRKNVCHTLLITQCTPLFDLMFVSCRLPKGNRNSR